MVNALILATLTLAATLSASAQDLDTYSGENILRYLKPGQHLGAGCEVEVSVSDSRQVMLSVKTDTDYVNFNTSTNRKKDITESAKPNEYVASFVLIPDDQYSGQIGNRIAISKQNGSVKVTLTTLKKFLGVWRVHQSAICVLRR